MEGQINAAELSPTILAALEEHRLQALQLLQERLAQLGPCPSDYQAQVVWQQQKAQTEQAVEAEMQQQRLAQGLAGAWEQQIQQERLKWAQVVNQNGMEGSSAGLQPASLAPEAASALPTFSAPSASPQQQVSLGELPPGHLPLANGQLPLMTSAAMLDATLMLQGASGDPGTWSAAMANSLQLQELPGPGELHLDYPGALPSPQAYGLALPQQPPSFQTADLPGAGMQNGETAGEQPMPASMAEADQQLPHGEIAAVATAADGMAWGAVVDEAAPVPGSKVCRLCGGLKPLDQFHVNNSNADKHDTRCKGCCATYEKEKRAKKQRVLEPTVSEKACRTCKEVKPAAEYYRYTYSKDGLYQQCKACHAKAGKNRLGGNASPSETKVCSKCGEEKGASDFYTSKYLSSGLHSQCKKCVRQGQEKKVRCPPEATAEAKVCRRCRQEKPAAEFYKNPLVSDGLTTYCRTCTQLNNQRPGGAAADGAGASSSRYCVLEPTKAEKYCRRCELTKPADEFYRVKTSSDGLASHCKACAVRLASETRKHFNPEPLVEAKVCKTCRVQKPAKDFYRNRTNADGLFGKCKACSDAQAEANRKPRLRYNVAEPTVEHKVCTKCRVDKPADAFNRDKTKHDGLQFRCKECVHNYMRGRRTTETRKRKETADHASMQLATNNLTVLAQAAEEPRELMSD